jgi:hypothetical protein
MARVRRVLQRKTVCFCERSNFEPKECTRHGKSPAGRRVVKEA